MMDSTFMAYFFQFWAFSSRKETVYELEFKRKKMDMIY